MLIFAVAHLKVFWYAEIAKYNLCVLLEWWLLMRLLWWYLLLWLVELLLY